LFSVHSSASLNTGLADWQAGITARPIVWPGVVMFTRSAVHDTLGDDGPQVRDVPAANPARAALSRPLLRAARRQRLQLRFPPFVCGGLFRFLPVVKEQTPFNKKEKQNEQSQKQHGRAEGGSSLSEPGAIGRIPRSRSGAA
jgi:hypothetical protein